MIQPAIIDELGVGCCGDDGRLTAAEYLTRYYLGGVFSAFLHWFKYDKDTPLGRPYCHSGAIDWRSVALQAGDAYGVATTLRALSLDGSGSVHP